MEAFIKNNKVALTKIVNVNHHIDINMDDMLISLYASSPGQSRIRLSDDGELIIDIKLFITDKGISIINLMNEFSISFDANDNLTKGLWLDSDLSESAWCDLVQELLSAIIEKADLTTPVGPLVSIP